MKTYRVRYNPEAINDMDDSFEWGMRNWGELQALAWIRGLHALVRKRLVDLPLSCPIAPEGFESGFEIRQLVYGRYRILFTVKQDEVLVMYLRGPFNG